MKPVVAKGITSPRQSIHMDDSKHRFATIKHVDPRSIGEPSVCEPCAPWPKTRKRCRDSASETITDNCRPFKRSSPISLSSTERLCQECAAIRWNNIDQWLNYEGRFTWIGKPIAEVGKRYRNVSPSTTCPLCRQLQAPWIDSFVKQSHPDKHDWGDQIHVFRHLRHLPHVNDYPTSVQQMRKHGAPFHIAVVPILRGWKDELREHFATRGMVLVVPPGQKDSEIFHPQKVSPKFDPHVVRSWMTCCGQHKTLCRPGPPGVNGLKLIDCNSEDLVIRKYSPEDRYVALSYVWGKSAPGTSQTPPPKQRKGNQQRGQETCKAMKGTNGNIRRIVEPNKYLGHIKQRPPIVRRTPGPGDSRPRLPKSLPLTVQDAIRVTKSLGFRFLWVDKYCIDQTNEQEKQEQFSRMGDIYAGAQLTLFALGHDASYGLPGVSSKPRYWQQQSTSVPPYQMISTMPDPHLCIKQSQWSNRGWTYQEGLFSTRCLFFTDNQVYFECNAMNMTESFKSNLKILHTQNGQRLRAYHRAGRFVCGNSNSFSHVKVMQSQANHRKIDIIRRCQFQIRQYTKRELTYKNDVLNAFAGIARYYAKTTAQIASLAGIPVPFPLAKLPDRTQEGLDHLSYALAWGHRLDSCVGVGRDQRRAMASSTHRSLRWDPRNNPKPQRRFGFPSWSWAGWFGEIGRRSDFPHCWTSLLSDVKIGFQGGSWEDLGWLLRSGIYRQFMIRKLLTANELQLKAAVLNPEWIKWWENDPDMPSRQIQCSGLHVSLSVGASSLEELRQKLVNRDFECLVLGTYGEPRQDVMRAIRSVDKKSSKARFRRIDLLEREDADGIVGLIVRKKRDGKYERVGLLKVDFGEYHRERGLEAWVSRTKRRFVLV